MVERISCLRRCCAIRATSPNQGGAEGTDWQEDWTMTDPSAILSMSISLMRMGCTSSLRRHIFCSDASCYTLVAHSVGTARIPPKSQLNFGEAALATIAVCLRWGTGIDPILGIVRIVRAQLMMGEKVAHADELQQRIPKRHAQQWHLIPHGTVS